MRDGLYRVDYRNVCAGFVIKNGRIVMVAPILAKSAFLRSKAVRIDVGEG